MGKSNCDKHKDDCVFIPIPGPVGPTGNNSGGGGTGFTGPTNRLAEPHPRLVQ